MSKSQIRAEGAVSDYEQVIRPIRKREHTAIFLFTLAFLYFSFAALQIDHGGLDEAHAAFYGWATPAGATLSLATFVHWIQVRSQKFEVMKRFGRFPHFVHKLLAK